jgi:hypothetical protein
MVAAELSAPTPVTPEVIEPCRHLTLHRILIVGQPFYKCGACDKNFEVPQLHTIVVENHV